MPTKCGIIPLLLEVRINDELSQKIPGIKASIDQFSASARMTHKRRTLMCHDFGTIKHIAKVLKISTAHFYCENNDLSEIIKEKMK